MSAEVEVQVRPQGDGTWAWQRLEDGDVADSGTCSDRTLAIAEARAAAGSETVQLYREDGSPYGSARKPGCRVVLLNLDGSLYGELDPEPSSGGTPQIVSIEPTSDAEQAVNLDG